MGHRASKPKKPGTYKYPPQDHTGRRCGLLTVLSPQGQRESNGAYLWLARCECGRTKVLDVPSMAKAKSCGCLQARCRHKGLSFLQTAGTAPGKRGQRNTTDLLDVADGEVPW